MSKHTPTPWEWWKCGSQFMLSSVSHGKLIILQATRDGMQGATLRVRDHNTCTMHKITHEDEEHPDLKFILRAVNSYDDLLAACRDLLDGFWDMSPLEYAASRNVRDAGGVMCMSDEEGERIKARARAAVAKATEVQS